MANTFQNLYEFVDLALRNRKYPSGTANGYKAALRLFEPELNEEERGSLAAFQKSFDSIYQAVFNKNKSKMSAPTLETYKRRVRALVNDYEKYGVDPSKLATWNRTPRIVHRVSNKKPVENSQETDLVSPKAAIQDSSITMNRLEIMVRPNVIAILIMPSDLKEPEAQKIIKIINATIVS